MKRLLLTGFALICAVPALAQTTSAPSAPPAAVVPNATMPAPARPLTGGTTYSAADTTHATMPTGAVPGANSFTESQARSRLEKNGYSQVSGLKKGDDGIWRGSAMRNGGSVQVSVDYKGDISMN
jgi:protein CpxP